MPTRREAIAALASAAALPLVTFGCGQTAQSSLPADAEALKLLDGIANALLTLLPESATSLGIDFGSRAGLRSQLADRSEAENGVSRLRSKPI